MDSDNGKTRMNVEGDRLSNLPDDLIHKILAFVDTKQAVHTSTLSSRWRYIWTSLPELNFSDKHFHTLTKFFKFVKGVLSRRNNQIDVYSVKLTLHGVRVTKASVERILNIILKYAASHNLQQLNIACICKYSMVTPFNWRLLALTTLYLEHLAFDNYKASGLFSNFVNLKNLTLSYRGMGRPRDFDTILDDDVLNICHPGLSNLTLINGVGIVTVVAPQLKNLIIRNWDRIFVNVAPNLASLRCEGHYYPLQLPTNLNLEKVDLCSSQPLDFFYDNAKAARKIIFLFKQLHSVKFLTLNLEIIEILCSCVELISHQPSPFTNLKRLKIHPKSYFTRTQPKVTMRTKVKDYLLGGSPDATFT